MRYLYKTSSFVLCAVSAMLLSSSAAAKHISSEPHYEAKTEIFEPYRCDGNALISENQGVISLNTLKYFGTSITIDLYDAQTSEGKVALCNALNVIQKYHYHASNYSTYPNIVNVKSINNDPATRHTISSELTEILAASIEWYGLSDGYFNIALSPVIDVWRTYRNNCNKKGICKLPSDLELTKAAQYTKISDINLDTENNTISMKAGMSIDLGGIAKGWMAEKVYEQLKSDGMTSFMINAGGNIRHFGRHPEGREFATAIEDPLCKKSDYQLERCQTPSGLYHEIIKGEDLTIVSSGNYLNYFTVDGKDYHHIINPKTLYPKEDGISVSTILKSKQICADVISTALFLMPIEQAITFADENQYIKSVWYLDEDGNKRFSHNFND
ncbi:FAD:protein FMN transferase [Shewanella sp. UCD-KL12]|uniref:FAD:protein FMN transferase n=1 Tax=Shewanella sp. UCD-KL12 TaxID=1917163 RepID=UPI002116BB31|nr:FAD:protein FMN transferase [Shewanella sp. UCD-KL12]